MTEAVADAVEARLREGLRPVARERVVRLRVDRSGDSEPARPGRRAVGQGGALRHGQRREEARVHLRLGDDGSGAEDLDEGADGGRGQVAGAAPVTGEVEPAGPVVGEPPGRALGPVDSVEELASADDVGREGRQVLGRLG